MGRMPKSLIKQNWDVSKVFNDLTVVTCRGGYTLEFPKEASETARTMWFNELREEIREYVREIRKDRMDISNWNLFFDLPEYPYWKRNIIHIEIYVKYRENFKVSDFYDLPLLESVNDIVVRKCESAGVKVTIRKGSKSK